MLLLRKRVHEYIKQHSTKLDRFAIITRTTDSQLTSTASQTRRAVWSVKSELEIISQRVTILPRRRLRRCATSVRVLKLTSSHVLRVFTLIICFTYVTLLM